MKRMLLNIAASALIMGVVGAAPATDVSLKLLRQADKAAAQATSALREYQRDDAVRYAERAVLYNPASADNRALLGQAYLHAGRLHSAQTAFADALRLDATHGRAALGLGLVENALGNSDRALSALAQARGRVPETDLGLALALTGDLTGAMALLEPAARAEGASPKARQNLALAYALSGRWAEARVTASQDLAPNLLDQRMMQWAQFVRPRGSADQLASLIGVKPVMDSGMPTALALLEAPAAQHATAVVAPAAEPLHAPAVAIASLPAPLEPVAPLSPALSEVRTAPAVAAASPVEAPSPVRPVAVEPSPYLVEISPSGPKVAEVQPSYVAPVVAAAKVRPVASTLPSGGGFVVQLGAFSSEARLEQAWERAIRNVASLGGYTPMSSAFGLSGGNRTVYRLAISGFSSRMDAATLCVKVRAKGGDCFVRGRAGDSPVQWVSRKTRDVYASR